MADISTRLHDQTLLLQWGDSVHAGNAADVFVNAVEILIEAERSPDVRAVLLLGGLGVLPQLQQCDACVQELHNLLETLETCSRPVLAVLDGVVSAVGLSLALACDGVLASRGMRLQPHTVALAAGLSWPLGQRLPRALATQLLLAPHTVLPAQLHAAGVLNAVADTGAGATDQALQLAAAMAQQPAAVLQSAKDLLRQARHASLHEQLQAERQAAWVQGQRQP